MEKVGEIRGVNLRVGRVETVELAELFQCFQCSKRGGKRGDFLLCLLLSFPPFFFGLCSYKKSVLMTLVEFTDFFFL